MKFVISGGKKLSGEIQVMGAKNAALPLIAATLLTEEECVFTRMPRISDVETMIQILHSVGARAEWTGDHELTVCTAGAKPKALDQHLVKKFRGSIVFLGPFLARFHSITISEPGGCIIGNRPLDAHFHGLSKLGVRVARLRDQYSLKHRGLKGSEIIFLEASVTATENLIMAASKAQGVTLIKNAACEPHVQDLAHFLTSMGAIIEGIGTSNLRITGVPTLHGARHTVIPDPIEAGTFIIMALATRSDITVKGVRADHLDVVLEKLRSMGAQFDNGKDWIRIKRKGILKAARIDARLYPGIPTDLQALFGVLATQADGTSLIHDTVFDGRFAYIQELVTMGANASVCDSHRALITGPTPLRGQEIRSTDLRAGMTLIIAGLLAQGRTTIHNAEIIDRGYERIEERLRRIGATITRE